MTSSSGDILVIEGLEQSLVDPALPDAGLPPAVGVHSWCVFRASRDAIDLSDGRGWTYHHHVDLAIWKGRLYVGWNSCERDEDVWPSRELFSTSVNGVDWDPPKELFPQGVSTPLRMYFFHAPNGQMLAIAGMRINNDKTDEDLKTGIVVRQIHTDHLLGPVYALQSPTHAQVDLPFFESSADSTFVSACHSLLADTVYLEQQDRGKLLGDRAMKWHEAKNWPGGKVPGDNEKWVSGKAFSFYRRPDDVLVGISKMGWTTTSIDAGKTWAMPQVPATLVTGKAKVWSQKTADDRFALVYNPSTSQRFPLIAVAGTDGVHFSKMRVIHGELPIQRYAGADRSVGPQYVRGASEWSDDGSRRTIDGNAMWLVYSMSKEDIWVTRVPVPIVADASGCVEDDFEKSSPGPIIEGWNVYSPKWASIACSDEALTLLDPDPYDYARITRVFAEAKRIKVRVLLTIEAMAGDDVEIEVCDKFGSAVAICVRCARGGTIHASSETLRPPIGRWSTGSKFAISMDCSAGSNSAMISISDAAATTVPFATKVDTLQRLSIRTGPRRGMGGKRPVARGTDKPIDPTIVKIHHVSITT